MPGAQSRAARRRSFAIIGLIALGAIAVAPPGGSSGTAEPGAPWPSMPARDAQSHEVLALGDSLMGNTLSQIGGLAPEAVFRAEHRNGSGLVSPILLNPADANSPLVAPDVFVTAMMNKWPNADTVFVEWAGACSAPCAYPYGSDAFYNAWWAMVKKIHDLVLARGKRLVWAISPPAPPGGSTTPYVYNQQVSDNLSWTSRSKITDVLRADMWGPLAVDDGFLGHYAQWLNYFWWPEYSDHQVRANDLVHMTSEGAYRSAYWSTIALRQAFATAAPPPTTTTTTTTTTSTTTTSTTSTTTSTSTTTTTTSVPPPTTTTLPKGRGRGKPPK